MSQASIPAATKGPARSSSLFDKIQRLCVSLSCLVFIERKLIQAGTNFVKLKVQAVEKYILLMYPNMVAVERSVKTLPVL